MLVIWEDQCELLASIWRARLPRDRLTAGCEKKLEAYSDSLPVEGSGVPAAAGAANDHLQRSGSLFFFLPPHRYGSCTFQLGVWLHLRQESYRQFMTEITIIVEYNGEH
jgi:hypothetical protein